MPDRNPTTFLLYGLVFKATKEGVDTGILRTVSNSHTIANVFFGQFKGSWLLKLQKLVWV
jgi:hypothetical protein